MALKKTLLEIVQDILSAMDSDEVNALSDSTEAEQIAEVVESTYYDIISQRDIPEHKSFMQLTALSDSNFPTHFTYPTNSNRVERIWYDTSDDNSFEYDDIEWCDPLTFVERLDGIQESYTLVDDKSAGTKLRIVNDKHPEFYTSFDDQHIVMNSHKATVDATLRASKSRAYGTLYPVFNRNSDTFVPDIDADQFPYLIAEAKSRCFDMFKGGTTSKVEQAARRNKVAIINKRYKTIRGNAWNDYGR